MDSKSDLDCPRQFHQLGCDIGGAKELGVIYFPTNGGAKEPRNLPNHTLRVGQCPVAFKMISSIVWVRCTVHRQCKGPKSKA